MFPSLIKNCQTIVQRFLVGINDCATRSYALQSWKRTGETAGGATATKKKRIKYKKPAWITENVLFVANFPKSATEAELVQYFSQVGFVTEFRKFDFAPFGWCFFENVRHADRARRALHGSYFQGQKLKVFEGQRTRRRPYPEVIQTTNIGYGYKNYFGT